MHFLMSRTYVFWSRVLPMLLGNLERPVLCLNINMTSFFKKSGEQDMLLGMYSAGSLPILSHFCQKETWRELFEILYIEKGYYPIPLSKAIYYSQLL